MLTAALVAFNLVAIFAVLAMPVGQRSFRLTRRIDAPPGRVWSALWPLGENAGWSGEILEAEPCGQGGAEIALSWPGRDGKPIRRRLAFADVVPGARFATRVVHDSSLADSFWAGYRQQVRVDAHGDATLVTIVRTDSYRGLAFLIFRYFAARRELRKLARWAETGVYKPGGVFEHPATQGAMAALSALILWPFFGLTVTGLAMAATLTAIVAAHELGHMAAFRLMGHRSTRMIFIPVLGGIAIGGRPYDSRYEIAFVALMGAGFSAFLVPLAIVGHNWAALAGYGTLAAFAGGVAACTAFFNLANIAPVWRFDGGQILRQIVPENGPRALCAFLLLSMLLGFGALAGFTATSLVVAGAVLALIGVMTAGSGARPREEMKPITNGGRAMIAAGLVAVYVIHGTGVVWAVRHYL